jgi:hypothetical protein
MGLTIAEPAEILVIEKSTAWFDFFDGSDWGKAES